MALFRLASSTFTNFVSRGAGLLFPRLSSTSVARQPTEEDASKQIIDTVKSLIDAKESRAFAIVHLLGKQWRVTDGDLILLEGHWPPKIGDEINLEKVLLAGTKDFTLIGRPLVQPGLVKITATVIAKGLSHTKTSFRKKRRKQYMNIKFFRGAQTTLRINTIKIGSNLDEPDNVIH